MLKIDLFATYRAQLRHTQMIRQWITQSSQASTCKRFLPQYNTNFERRR